MLYQSVVAIGHTNLQLHMALKDQIFIAGPTGSAKD